MKSYREMTAWESDINASRRARHTAAHEWHKVACEPNETVKARIARDEATAQRDEVTKELRKLMNCRTKRPENLRKIRGTWHACKLDPGYQPRPQHEYCPPLRMDAVRHYIMLGGYIIHENMTRKVYDQNGVLRGNIDNGVLTHLVKIGYIVEEAVPNSYAKKYTFAHC